ncbi:MAG: hypothetical protein IJ484_06860, partial [Oscillospiraceae bacterium]|nr:hypothetical protein [Oscillospiraceae bacterium]
IAGRSYGYLYDCENTAEIFGRKDVGGITGQMEPYIAQNLTESTLAKLQRQLDELDVLLDRATRHADGTSDAVTNRLNGIADATSAAGAAAQNIRTTGTVSSTVNGSGSASGSGGATVTPAEGGTGGNIQIGDGSLSGSVSGSVSGGVASEGSSATSGSLGAQTQISISTDLPGLSSSLYGMAGQMSLLSGELDGASDSLKADVEQIRAKIGEITDTGFELILGDGEEDVIVDSSELDIDLITLGKAARCTNRGSVDGDLNVGGIAGVMGLEYALDPEDDVTVSVEGSTRRKYEVKAVMQHCENTGTVTAKRNYTGGIVGKMDLGLIAECTSYGPVSSEGGSYVGGIAGIGGSTIRHCFSKCSLSGGKYIGGIVGSGVQEDRSGESSTVAGCYAIVTIPAHKQYAGAISGAYAGVFLENYFVSEELAGIDRISYTGCAELIPYEELLARFTQAEETPDGETAAIEKDSAAGDAAAAAAATLPNAFRTFTLKFVVDGEVVHSELFDYGASFGPDVFPELPRKDGCYGYWDRTDLNGLTFDTTVTAVYEPYVTALAGDETRDGERPVFFAKGNFAEGDALTAEPMPLTPAQFDLAEGVWDAAVQSLTAGVLRTEVVEQWSLLLPEDGLEEHTVRYLPPDGKADRMEVYLRQDGQWARAGTEVVGSYVTFPVEGTEAELAVVVTAQTGWVRVAVAALGLLLLAAAARGIRRLARRRPKPPAPQPEEPSPAAAQPTPKQSRWRAILPVLLALLAGIGGTAAFFLLPDLVTGAGAYELLSACARKEPLSMVLDAEVTVGETSCPIKAELHRTSVDGHRVTVVSEGSRSLYYCDGAVFLENGTAYEAGAALPDYSALLEQAMALYRHADIEAEDDTYTITASGADAKAILELLLPSTAALADTDSLTVKLFADGDEPKRIEFTGSGALSDRSKTGYSVRAALTFLKSPAGVELPAPVAKAIATGDYEPAGALTDDLYRLAAAWQELESRDPLAATLTLSADCGPLVLDKSLQLHRWHSGESDVFCVQENGYALYFSDGAICDSKGNAIPAATAANVDTAKLLDIAYAACMNTSASHTVSSTRHTYTLALDESGMKAVAYAIAPEAEKLNIAFGTGSLRVTIAEEQIEQVELTVRGSVQVVLAHADVSIGAQLDFAAGSADAALPQAVADALQSQKGA